MQSNNPNLPRRYSIIEGNAVEATGTVIQFISITEWPFLQAVLLLDSPQERAGNIVSYPANRIKALPTQEEANATLGQDKTDYITIVKEERYNKLIKSWNETIKELNYLKQHNEELRLEIAANKEQFKVLMDSNEGLQKQVKDKECKLFSCANEILNLHDRIKLLEMQKYDLIKSIDSKDTELSKLKETIEKLTKDLKEFRINYTQKIEGIKRQFHIVADNL